ncbi:hypothetical protein VNO77_11136 [Canavalia gladiata]|uniref:Uncharacterized protein n=1 Tax=Canavalia gladiata TaxID=3824 RepID=A0AAN9MHR4_CANGL
MGIERHLIFSSYGLWECQDKWADIGPWICQDIWANIGSTRRCFMVTALLSHTRMGVAELGCSRGSRKSNQYQ